MLTKPFRMVNTNFVRVRLGRLESRAGLCVRMLFAELRDLENEPAKDDEASRPES
jgi:hypothetical protein